MQQRKGTGMAESSAVAVPLLLVISSIAVYSFLKIINEIKNDLNLDRPPVKKRDRPSNLRHSTPTVVKPIIKKRDEGFQRAVERTRRLAAEANLQLRNAASDNH